MKANKKGNGDTVSDIGFDLKGLNNLSKDLTKAIRCYPDLAESRLRDIANIFRKDVALEEKKVVKNDDYTNISKLTSIEGYSIGKPRVSNDKIEVDFSANSEEFSLVENGYNQVNSDGKIRWVEGNHVVKNMCENYAVNTLPSKMDDLLKEIIKECDLS